MNVSKTRYNACMETNTEIKISEIKNNNVGTVTIDGYFVGFTGFETLSLGTYSAYTSYGDPLGSYPSLKLAGLAIVTSFLKENSGDVRC